LNLICEEEEESCTFYVAGDNDNTEIKNQIVQLNTKINIAKFEDYIKDNPI
jgi:hypothetical protein